MEPPRPFCDKDAVGKNGLGAKQSGAPSSIQLGDLRLMIVFRGLSFLPSSSLPGGKLKLEQVYL